MNSSSAARTDLSLRSLLYSAPEEALREFIPLSVRDLLVAIDPNMLTKQRLRDLICALWTSGDLLVDDSLRGHVIALLDLFATKRTDASLLGLTATLGRTWADIDSDAGCPREVL